ncbi:MAG: CRISPR-associated endoribonuclease Cas6 [Bacteroidales bacterium]|nr:CRISPR-associated endoribonuclease Cas6 [Bacteroidales bacterium]
MRIHLRTNNKRVQLPFDHQHLLVGTIHKWLGLNDEHGKLSLYSFSRLEGATTYNNGLLFEKGAGFFISSFDPQFIKRIINGVRKDPAMFNDLQVDDINIEDDPFLNDRSLFFPASPIFIKRKINDTVKHVLFDDPEADQFLSETMQNKLKLAGLIIENFSIKFEKNARVARTKKISYNGIENKANWCPVLIEGSNNIKQFAWNVGLGNSTGIGFGAIK